MSWIDQGRQQHGWFGHGAAPEAATSARELRERAFAIVQLAGGRLTFPLERTTDILRTLAPMMAPSSSLSPNDFRQRFFRDAFDPVDAWHLQLFMRDVARADDHAGLKDGGHALAMTIDHYGAKDWSSMLGRAVSNLEPTRQAGSEANGGPIQKAQMRMTGPTMLPVPPVAVPGSRENEEYFVKPVIKLGRAIGDAVGNIFRSESPDNNQPGAQSGNDDRPEYRQSASHDSRSSSYNPRKDPEPADAEEVYQDAERDPKPQRHKGTNGTVRTLMASGINIMKTTQAAPTTPVLSAKRKFQYQSGEDVGEWK